MAGFLKKLKAQAAEAESVRDLFETPRAERPVLVYAEDDYTWNQLAGYVEQLTERHRIPVTYISSDRGDPILTSPPPLVTPIMIREQLPLAFPRFDSPFTLTTMPDLDQFGLKRPRNSHLIYTFHSLNSTHMAYREGAFDAYDAFFCTGPYQKRELAARFAHVGRTDVVLHDVGYYKLDRLRERHVAATPPIKDRPTVVIAPSWGPGNILESFGSVTIAAIADMGLDVVVRPHPAFFEGIYSQGASIVSHLETEFAAHSNVKFEHSIASEDALIDGDMLVSDWSGVAFEFAFSTERPVVFLDTPRKETNPNWRAIAGTPFEDRLRSEVGIVVEPGDRDALQTSIKAMLDYPKQYKDRIVEARDKEVFNFGTAAAVGASIIAEQLAMLD